MVNDAANVRDAKPRDISARAAFAPETVVRLSSDQISCEVDGEAIILQLKRGEYFGLNKMGSVVWRMLQAGPATLEAIQTAIVTKYEVEDADCRADLQDLLSSLRQAELIEVE